MQTCAISSNLSRFSQMSIVNAIHFNFFRQFLFMRKIHLGTVISIY